MTTPTAFQWRETRMFIECPHCTEVVDGEERGWDKDSEVHCPHCGGVFTVENRPT